MRLLIDTHALLWWLAGDESLSLAARAASRLARPDGSGSVVGSG